MKLQAETLSRGIFMLCLLAPWSLLWLDSALIFPYVTGKAWLFRAIVSVAFSLLIVYWLAFRRADSSPKPAVACIRLWQLSLLIFMLWTALANVLGIDWYRSMWSNYERMSGYISYLYWAAYFLCLISVLSQRRVSLLLVNLLAVILMTGLAGLAGIGSSEQRLISTLGNPIYLGNLMVSGIFMSGFLFFGLNTRSRWRTIAIGLFSLLVATLLLLVLLKTASRGPMIALLAGGLVVLTRLAFSCSSKTRYSLLFALIAGAILIVTLGAGLNQQLVSVLKSSDSYALQRLSRISLHNQTTVDRLENWKIALHASNEHPLTGWGQGNYAIAYHEHYRAGVMDNAKIWFDRAHNAYLDVLLASGWPGLLLYVLMLSLPAILIVRHSGWRPQQQAFMLGFLSAYVVKNLVGFDTFSSSLVWLSIAAMIHFTTGRSSVPSERKPRKFAGLALTLALSASVLSINNLNIKPYFENRLFQKTLKQSLTLQSDSIQALMSLSAIDLVYAPNAKLAVFDQLLRRHSGQPLDDQQQALQMQLVLKAGTVLSQELQRQPRNARISYNGAMLLAYLGRYELSSKLLRSILVSSPQRTVIWNQLAKVYQAAGNHGAANKAYAQQHALNENWGKK